jgi:hypothetical protein
MFNHFIRRLIGLILVLIVACGFALDGQPPITHGQETTPTPTPTETVNDPGSGSGGGGHY